VTENTNNGRQNIYKPAIMKIVDKRDEAPGVKTLRLEFLDPLDHEMFRQHYYKQTGRS
jgi:hypothetical protein